MTILHRPRGQYRPGKIRIAVSSRIAVLPCLVLPCPPQLSGSPYLLAPSLFYLLSCLPFIFLPSSSFLPSSPSPPFIFPSLPSSSASFPFPPNSLCSSHVCSLSPSYLSYTPCDSYIRLLDLPSWNGLPPPTLLPRLLLAVPVLLKEVTDPAIHYLSSVSSSTVCTLLLSIPRCCFPVPVVNPWIVR